MRTSTGLLTELTTLPWNELTHRLVKKRVWTLKPRSLTNRLSALNKGEEIEWWLADERGQLLNALAQELKVSISNLTQTLRDARTPQSGSVHRLDVFPALRQLNLAEEDPFPGVPLELIKRGGPSATLVWWVAPPGAGKTMVGRWLRLRQGWALLEGRAWRSEVTRLAPGCRVFLELAQGDTVSTEDLQLLPEGARFIVASTRPPPTSGENQPPRNASAQDGNKVAGQGSASDAPKLQFTIIESPPPSSWLEALVRWADDRRTKRDGAFSFETALKFIRAIADRGLIRTPGDALPFLDLVDQKAATRLQKSTPEQLVETWLLSLVERQDRPGGSVLKTFLERVGARLLIEIETERLKRFWPTELTESQWRQLVPEKYRAPVDVEKLDELLKAKQVGGAREMLRPDADSIARRLIDLGVLSGTQTGLFSIQPQGLARLILEGVAELVEKDYSGLPLLLMNGESVDFALRRLVGNFCDGKLPVTLAWLRRDESSPEFLVTVDGLFRAAGFALTLGAKIEPAFLLKLAEIQNRFSEKLSDIWPDRFVSVGLAPSRRGLSTEGGWVLGACAIWHQLKLAELSPPPLLFNLADEAYRAQSHQAENLPRGQTYRLEHFAMEHARNELHHAFKEATGMDERLAPYRLGHMLLDSAGPSLIGRQTEAAFVRGAKTGAPLGAETVIGGLNFEALNDACVREGVTLQQVFERWWTAYDPTYVGFVEGWASPEQMKTFWSALSLNAFKPKFARELANTEEAWPWLQVDIWRQLGAHLPWFEVPLALLRKAPEEFLIESVKSLGDYSPWNADRQGLAILWDRVPDAVRAQVEQGLSDFPNPTDALFQHVLDTAPDPQVELLLSSIGPSKKPWVRRWLISLVAGRGRFWREAHSLLTR